MDIITFSIIDELHNEVTIKVKSITKFKIVADSFNERQGNKKHTFTLNGITINEMLSIQKLNIKENDVVDATVLTTKKIKLTIIKGVNVLEINIDNNVSIYDHLTFNPHVIMLHNGDQLKKTDTALSLNLNDNDIIELFQ